MTFADQITRAPLAYDPELAEDALQDLGWAQGRTRDLLKGTAGCSPFLAGLMRRHSVWLEQALQQAPDAVVPEILDALDVGASKEVALALRTAKQRVALFTALADLGGVWDLNSVTTALTELADKAVDISFKTALMPELSRGKLPGHGPEDLDQVGGLFALAMGKMGAFELNYSSDIDLICLFDDSLYESADLGEARAVLVKTVRRAMALLSDITGDGYVFRTDLRLRPDPSVTPIVLSIAAAERYYEALGRTWERAAFVKARPCAGAAAAGDRFLREIRPFIWRKHLDFTTVQDAQDIRQKIRIHKNQPGGNALDGRNLKLCRGGIREIEFFTQTRQLIAGGRDKSLRVRGTREGLARLARKGWVGGEEAQLLDQDYVRLRELEHRAQMVQDAQTHALPGSPEGWQRMAMFAGTGDVIALQREIREIFAQVHELTEEFFAPQRAKGQVPELTGSTTELIERWRSYPALRTTRAQQIFRRLLPDLLTGFNRAAQPDEAIVQFDGFLKGLPAGVQLFSLFEANPHLIDLVVDIASTSPALAHYLSGHSRVLDAVIDGDFFTPWPGRDALERELTAILSDPELDFEKQLDAARQWQHDWHFRIGVHHLRGLIDPDQAALEYTDLARACVAGIWQVTCAEFGRKHGPLPGRGAIVLGMGSLGAQALSAMSDLDLILIYDAESDAESTGRRPLPARTYYARLTKALITALSTQTAAGTLYEVDMRLRPSGRQGPAAASWSSFQTYQRNEAWTWEHLALTRADVVTGEDTLAADFESFRQQILSSDAEPAKICADLSEMRRRLAEAKPRQSVWDISNGAGGLQDVELFGQALARLTGRPCRRVDAQLGLSHAIVPDDDLAQLRETYDLLHRIKSVGRLLTEKALDPETLGVGGQAVLLRDTQAADLEGLSAAIATQTEAAAQIIDVALATCGDGNEQDVAGK